MAFSEGDKAVVRDIAREVVGEAGPAIAREAARLVIDDHAEKCPLRKDVEIVVLQKQAESLRFWIKVLLLAVGSGGAAGMFSQIFG